MAPRPQYERGFSFAAFEANQPKKPPPGQRIDIELDEIAASLLRAGTGASAYDIAVQNGFVGTEAEYLESLKSTVPGPSTTVNGKTGGVIDLSAMDIPYTAVGQAAGQAAARNAAVKLYEIEINVEDYPRLVIEIDDLPRIKRSYAAAPGAGAVVVFQSGVTYNINGDIPVSRSHLQFVSKGKQLATINSTSSTANHFTLGAAGTPYCNNLFIRGLIFTRSVVSTSGYCIEATNCAYGGVSGCRFYGNHNQFRGMHLHSVYHWFNSDMEFEGIRNEPIILDGGFHFGGNDQGNTVDIHFDYVQIADCNHHNPSPLGNILIGDGVQGIFTYRVVQQASVGKMYYFAGTQAFRDAAAAAEATNPGSTTTGGFLFFICDPNCEVRGADVGGFLYQSKFFAGIVVTHGWVSGQGMATIEQELGASDLLVGNLKIALNNATGQPAVTLRGKRNVFSACKIENYGAANAIGYFLDGGCDDTKIDGMISDFAYGIYNNVSGAPNFNIQVSFVGCGSDIFAFTNMTRTLFLCTTNNASPLPVSFGPLPTSNPGISGAWWQNGTALARVP